MSDSLTHYGVKGMKWGVRRAKSSTSKESSPRKKMNPKLKKELIKTGVTLGLYAATRAGLAYISRNPQVLQQAANRINGTRAIGVGYETITLAFKDGRWS